MWPYEESAVTPKPVSGIGEALMLLAAFSWRRFARRVRRAVVQKVPDEFEVCEFGCMTSHCSLDDWEHCEARRRYLEGSR